MITINLSDKEARQFYHFAIAVMGAHDVPAAKAVISSIERQLMPQTENKSELAKWRSEHVLPNIIKAWKRKHKKEINVEDLSIDELSPSKVAQYQLRYMESVCNQVLGLSFSFKGDK